MAEQTVEQLKQEVASEYFKKYKKELGRLQSLALYPIEKEVKNILSGQVNLPEKFDDIQEFGRWGKILGFISKDMASDLLNFMKEKRLEIEKRKTESALLELKSEVLGEKKPETPLPSSSSSSSSSPSSSSSLPTENIDESVSIASPATTDHESSTPNQSADTEQPKGQRSAKPGVIVTEVIAGAGIIDNIREGKAAKRAVREIGKENMEGVAMMTKEKIVKLNEAAKDGLRNARNNPRLTNKQIKNIDKAIQKFDQEMGKVGDDAIDVYNAYMKLGERMPKKVLQGIEMLDPKNAKKITKIADQLVGKNVDEMKVLLHSHHITGVSDDVVKELVKMGDNLDDFCAMAKVLSGPAKAKNIFHLVKSAFIIDIACLGFDIWMFTETLNEADLIAKVNEIRAENKKNQARTQLAIGVASFAAELGIIIVAASIGSTAGPVGTVVGLAVGAITAVASMGVDALYFDVQDFYLQNKEDYIRQSRAQLKQAILQHLHNKKEGNVSLDEKIGSPDKSEKDWTLKEAWKSIFFLEAVNDDKTQSEFSLLLAYKYSGQSETEFLGSKDVETHKEFEKQKKKLNEIIALKMEYVKKSFGEENVVAGLKSSQGMHYLSQLLAESTFYAERKQTGKWEEKSFEDNKAQAQKEFLETIPDRIERRLDTLYKTDKHFLYELYYGAKSYAKVIQKDEDVDSETDRTRNQHLRQNVEYLGNYIKSLELGNSREEQYRTQFSYGNLNYHYITAMLEHDFEMTGFEYQNFSTDAVKTIAYNNRERSTELPVSDKCSQNVLYRLAIEFYGYTGKNDAMELMQYYSEGEGHIHGLYYKDGRYINNDWAVDQKFDLTYLDDNNFSKAQTEKEVQKIVGNLLYENWTTVNPTMFVNPAMYAVNNLVLRPRKSMIDTPTEAIDKYLNDEFETRFRQILKEELGAKTTEKKQDIKHQIFTFIKEFSKDGGYVELPYYLVIAAKRAGLGDLEKTQFSYKNEKIVAVGQVHDLRAIGDLEVEKEFVEQARDTFTPEEMQYINLVEAAHKQVEALRKIEGRGSREDELDFPVEIEHDISQHYKDWNTFVGRLKSYAPQKAQSLLLETYKTYYEYFNALYLGILLSLNSFNWSNDIDTMSFFQQTLYHGQKDLFDEQGALKKNEKGNLEIKGNGIEEFYNKQLETQTHNGKPLKTLRASENDKDRELAKWYSRQILMSILEARVLRLDDKGNIQGMRDGRDGNTTKKGGSPYMDSGYKIDEKQFSVRLAHNLLHNPFTLPELHLPSQDKTFEQLQIRSYTQKDKKSEHLSKAIQKKIEQTLPNVEWQGRRGDVKFNPETSTLESRGQKSNIVFEGEDNIKIAGFSRSLDLESGIWLLNFMNWKHYQYPHQHVSHESEWSRTTWWNPRAKGLVVNGTMILTDTRLKSFIPSLSDGEIDEIALLLSTQQ